MCANGLYWQLIYNSVKWAIESPFAGGSNVMCFNVLNNLIVGSPKDQLGVLREGVWVVSLCLT